MNLPECPDCGIEMILTNPDPLRAACSACGREAHGREGPRQYRLTDTGRDDALTRYGPKVIAQGGDLSDLELAAAMVAEELEKKSRL